MGPDAGAFGHLAATSTRSRATRRATPIFSRRVRENAGRNDRKVGKPVAENEAVGVLGLCHLLQRPCQTVGGFNPDVSPVFDRLPISSGQSSVDVDTDFRAWTWGNNYGGT